MTLSRRTHKRTRNGAAADPPAMCFDCTGGGPSYAEPVKPYRAATADDNQDYHLSKTMSACTTATNTTCASTSSRSAFSHQLPAEHDPRCPVTGVHANIADDYHISHETLGKGHYGIVRECIHRATATRLAVKSIDKSKIGRLDHLQREIFILANVNHRGIMRMVDCYEDAEYVHIVTEKYTGGELFDQIIESTTPQGCFSEQRAARVIQSLLEAVAYLHDNGVCHRDIKPENVLFESNAEGAAVKLIDFGLSRRHSSDESPMSNPVGTAYYMSPELLKGRYDRSADLWAVGVVAYVLLCGYPPFNGSNDAEIQDATRRGRLHFAGSGWANKSDDAVDFVKCLLRRDPRKRFTAREALAHPWLRRAMRSF